MQGCVVKGGAFGAARLAKGSVAAVPVTAQSFAAVHRALCHHSIAVTSHFGAHDVQHEMCPRLVSNQMIS